MKKIISLLLCMVMLMTVLAGCGTTVEDVIAEYSDAEAVTDDTGSVRDYDAGRKAFDAEAVVLNIEGEDITWDEFYDWICFALSTYEYSYGEIADYSTYSDVIIEEAVLMATAYKSVEMKAEELGIGFDADIETQIAEDVAGAVEYYGSQEAYDEAVKQFYGSQELYEYIFTVDALSDDMFEELYGTDGEKLTDAQIAEGSEGYLMAKHILVLTTDDEGNALDEAAAAEVKDTIDSIYTMLTEYEGDDLEGYFDELTAQYTEDTGYAAYPDGYLFQEGDMVTEFYDAVNGIEIGQFSEVVESTYGYHIVFRLPVDAEAVPMQYASYGYNISLRSIIANDLLSEETRAWREEVEYTTTELYDSIDLAQLF